MPKKRDNVKIRVKYKDVVAIIMLRKGIFYELDGRVDRENKFIILNCSGVFYGC